MDQETIRALRRELRQLKAEFPGWQRALEDLRVNRHRLAAVHVPGAAMVVQRSDERIASMEQDLAARLARMQEIETLLAEAARAAADDAAARDAASRASAAGVTLAKLQERARRIGRAIEQAAELLANQAVEANRIATSLRANGRPAGEGIQAAAAFVPMCNAVLNRALHRALGGAYPGPAPIWREDDPSPPEELARFIDGYRHLFLHLARPAAEAPADQEPAP